MTSPSFTAKYDTDADVLYVAVGRPVPATTDEDDDGLIVRYALDDGHPCGVTILGFHSGWMHDLARLSRLVGRHLRLRANDVETALSAVIH